MIAFLQSLRNCMSMRLIYGCLVTMYAMRYVLTLVVSSVPTFGSFVSTCISKFNFISADRLGDNNQLCNVNTKLSMTKLQFSAVLYTVTCVADHVTAAAQENCVKVCLMYFILVNLMNGVVTQAAAIKINLTLTC